MLHAKLFGKPEFRISGKLLPLGEKASLLMAYLACHPEGVPRGRLLRLLWPAGKAHNLRQTLQAVRKLPEISDWLVDDGQVLRLQAQSDVHLLMEEKAIPSGVFLDVDVHACPDFEVWRDAEQHRLHQFRQRVRRAKAIWCQENEQPTEAVGLLTDLLLDDPLDEDAVQRLMRIFLQSQQREQATSLFIRFERDVLALGLHPQESTRELLGAQSDPASLLSQAQTLLEPDLRPGSAALWSRVLGCTEMEVALWMSSPSQTVPRPEGPLCALWHARLAEHLRQLDAKPLKMPVHVFLTAVAGHWEQARHFKEARSTFLEAASEAERVGANTEALGCLDRALHCTEPGGELELLFRKTALLETLGRIPELLLAARELHQHAALWQSDLAALGAHVATGVGLMRSGKVLESEQEVQGALGVLGRMDRARVPVPEFLRGRVCALEGALFLRAGRFLDAQRVFSQGLMFDVPNDLRVRLLANLGTVYGLQGALQDALLTLEDCVTLARHTQDLNVLGGVLVNLGTTAEKLGNSERAFKAFKEGVTLSTRLGMTPTVQAAYRNLAALHLRSGQLGYAWNTASELRDDHLSAELHLWVELLLSEIEWLCGDLQAAHRRLWALQEGQWSPSDRNHLQLQGYRALLHAINTQDDAPVWQVLQQAKNAGQQELVWDIGLDVLVHLQSPEKMQVWLDWLGSPQTPHPDFQKRHQLACLLHHWRSGKALNLHGLQALAEQDFLHSVCAARLLHHLDGRMKGQFQMVLFKQTEGLPEHLKLQFLNHHQKPLL